MYNVCRSSTTDKRECHQELLYIRMKNSHWELGVNYDQLTRVVQGYIVNEVNINEVYTCTDDCKYHVDREVYGCYKKDSYCPQDRGTGRIIRCEFDTNKDHVTLCPSDNPARRYEYFETNRGKKHNNFY
uniref:Uncharacterized protein n=1 Tax=Megaselia scalaris TaxID=36166 RepID=T1H5L1_MEGSC